MADLFLDNRQGQFVINRVMHYMAVPERMDGVSIRGVCVAYHDHMCEQSVVMKCLLTALWFV